MKYIHLCFFLLLSDVPASTVFGAAQPSDQFALPGGHQSDCTEGLCPALPVPSGKKQWMPTLVQGGLGAPTGYFHHIIHHQPLSNKPASSPLGETGINSAGGKSWTSQGHFGRRSQRSWFPVFRHLMKNQKAHSKKKKKPFQRGTNKSEPTTATRNTPITNEIFGTECSQHLSHWLEWRRLSWHVIWWLNDWNWCSVTKVVFFF